MKISLQNIRKILNTYDILDKMTISADVLDDAYKALPQELQSTVTTPQGKMMAIRRFVILNYLEITTIINNSKPEVSNDQVGGNNVQIIKNNDDEKEIDVKVPKPKKTNKRKPATRRTTKK